MGREDFGLKPMRTRVASVDPDGTRGQKPVPTSAPKPPPPPGPGSPSTGNTQSADKR
jgi:hypothetical protein